MANYLLADLVVDIRNRHPFLERQCRRFRCDDALAAAITVEVSEAEILKEKAHTAGDFSDGYIESICAYRKLCLQVPAFDGLFLHSSVIRVQQRGIAFLAPSGTGKTTHTALWKNMLGENMTVINGDKPIVRFWGGRPVAYGTPWAGKEDLYQKDSVTLTDLCFLERADANTCTPLKPEDCVSAIMHQVILPTDAEGVSRTLELTNRLLKSCRLWRIRCNTAPDAAATAYEAIMK